MPQAVGAALIKLAGAKLLAALAIKVAVNIAFAVGLSLLTNALFGPKRPKPSDGQTWFRGAIEGRRRYYGIVHASGLESFKESRNGTLGQVLTLGSGEESGEIIEHRINDKKVTVVGGTVTEASYRGAIHIYTRSGTDDQTAIAELTAKFPEWTADHRQLGCPLAAIISDPVKQKYFSEVFQGQEPRYSQIRKAVKVYDPRLDSMMGGDGPQRLNDKSTWGWSDNGALVIADYVAHPDGFGLGYDNINWTQIAAEADIADQDCTAVTGEVIARWRLWGGYNMAEDERRQVLADMMKACDAFCWQGADFKFNLMIGRYEAPAITLTDDHILSMNASLGPPAMQRVSGLKMLYTEKAIGYREQESATIWSPDTDTDANADPSATQLFWAPHHNQAVRIGKLMLARLGDRWHIEANVNAYGLNLIGRRFCAVSSAALGIAAEFMVESGVRIEVSEGEVSTRVTLVEIRPEDWDFDAATEEGVPPIAPEEDDGTPVNVPVPTGLALTAVQIAIGEVNGVAIEANWDEPTRADLSHQVQYRPTGGGTWVMMTVDDDAFTARSGPVDSGVEYEVQVRALTIGYRASAWSASVTITPEAAPSTIIPPFELTATAIDSDSVEIRYRQPRTLLLDYSHVLADETAVIGSAAQVGADQYGAGGDVVTITEDSIVAGPRSYWAVAFDDHGNDAAIGPVSINVGGFSFAGGSLPAGASLTRSGDGWHRNSSGVVTLAGTDVARFDYRWDGAAWVLAGLLVEPAATNILLHSADISTGWTKVAVTTPTATQLIETTATSTGHYVSQSVSFASGLAYAMSAYANEIVGSAKRYLTLILPSAAFGAVRGAKFDLATGTVTYTTAGVSALIEAAGPGRWRCCIVATASASAAGVCHVRLSDVPATSATPTYTGDGTSGLEVADLQIEEGSKPTSPIVTGASAVTRNADALVLDWSTNRHVPDGAMTTRYAFDDASTQDVATTVASGTATVPTTLNRHAILSAQKIS